MTTETAAQLQQELAGIKERNLLKTERVIESPQGAEILVGGRTVLNFCANNYLGLANHPAVVAAAKQALDRWGYGLSSVRFICGTQEVHLQLETAISDFLGTEKSILYSSCFDANAGVFETLLAEGDVVISDELNHASIIDGIRLCKAERKIFRHLDLTDLERALKESAGRRRVLVVTDGVFSMDGDITNLKPICDLTERYGALLMVDDSHATGFIGPTGRGTPEQSGVAKRVDLVTSTLGKALGGASGGFASGRAEIIDLLRQRSRPYLFSNSLAPTIAATSLAVFQLLQDDPSPRKRLAENTTYFRERITALGFDIRPGSHPIVPIMLYDAEPAQRMAAGLLEQGIYAVGFFYPVVPQGKARIRVQVSAAHTRRHLDQAVEAFDRVGREVGVIA